MTSIYRYLLCLLCLVQPVCDENDRYNLVNLAILKLKSLISTFPNYCCTVALSAHCTWVPYENHLLVLPGVVYVNEA
jgi:hypothetical protein